MAQALINLDQKLENIYGKQIKLLGKYKGFRFGAILFKCNKCLYKWKTSASYIIKGKGCPNCAKDKRELNYLNELYKLHQNNIILLDKFVGYENTKPLQFRCNLCSYKWYKYSRTMLYKNSGCPQCKIINKGRYYTDKLKNYMVTLL